MCCKSTLLPIFLLFVLNLSAQPNQKDKDKLKDKDAPAVRPSNFLLTINHDANLGFTPSVFGVFPIPKKSRFDYLFYGKFWLDPPFGVKPDRDDFSFEEGGGIMKRDASGKIWGIGGAFGLMNGQRLTGNRRGVVGDGLVFSLLGNYKRRRVEYDFWTSYYKAFRAGGNIRRDYFILTANGSLYLHRNFAIGGFFEKFQLTKITDGEARNLYTVLGGHFKFVVKDRFWMRFGVGLNFELYNEFSEEFYRLSAGISF